MEENDDETQSSQKLICCFGFSSKKTMIKKSRSSGNGASEAMGVQENDNILSDMGTFSVKEQERRLKKALEEEKRAAKEAEKVVQWVRYESARMDAATIEKIVSHNDEK